MYVLDTWKVLVIGSKIGKYCPLLLSITNVTMNSLKLEILISKCFATIVNTNSAIDPDKF